MRNTLGSILKIICLFSLPLLLMACQGPSSEESNLTEEKKMEKDQEKQEETGEESPEPPNSKGQSSSPHVPGQENKKRPDPGMELRPVNPPTGE